MDLGGSFLALRGSFMREGHRWAREARSRSCSNVCDGVTLLADRSCRHGSRRGKQRAASRWRLGRLAAD